MKWKAGQYNVHTAIIGQFMIQLEWSGGKWFYSISLMSQHRKSSDSDDIDVAKAKAEESLRQILDAAKL